MYRAFATLPLDTPSIRFKMYDRKKIGVKPRRTSDLTFIGTQTINRVAATGYFQEAMVPLLRLRQCFLPENRFRSVYRARKLDRRCLLFAIYYFIGLKSILHKFRLTIIQIRISSNFLRRSFLAAELTNYIEFATFSATTKWNDNIKRENYYRYTWLVANFARGDLKLLQFNIPDSFDGKFY